MALIKAAKKGSLEEVDKIVSKNPNLIDTENDNTGSTALIYSCYYGHYLIAKYLIDRGANLELKNASGSTPLMVASKNNHCSIMELLLDRGAKIDSRSKTGHTALMVAARNGHIQAVQVLLDKGANIWTKCERGSTVSEVSWKEEIKKLIKTHEDSHSLSARRSMGGNNFSMVSDVSSTASKTSSASKASKPASSTHNKKPSSTTTTTTTTIVKSTISSNSSVSSAKSTASWKSPGGRKSIGSVPSVASSYTSPRKTASGSSVATVPLHRTTPQRTLQLAPTKAVTKVPIALTVVADGGKEELAPSWQILFKAIRSFEQWHQYHVIHLQYQQAMMQDQYHVAKTLLEQLNKVIASVQTAVREHTQMPTDISLVSFDDLDSEVDRYSTNSSSLPSPLPKGSLKPDVLKQNAGTSPSSSPAMPPPAYRNVQEYLQAIFTFQKQLLAEKQKLCESCKQQVTLFPAYEQCYVYLHVMNVYAAQVMSLQQSMQELNAQSSASPALNVELMPVWDKCFAHVQGILQQHHKVLTSLQYKQAVESNDATKATSFYESLISTDNSGIRNDGGIDNGTKAVVADVVPNVFQNIAQYSHHLLSLRKELFMFQHLLQQIVKFDIKYFTHWKLSQELLTSLNQVITETTEGNDCGATEESETGIGAVTNEENAKKGLGKWMSGGQWISLWNINEVNEVTAYDQSIKSLSDDIDDDQIITY